MESLIFRKKDGFPYQFDEFLFPVRASVIDEIRNVPMQVRACCDEIPVHGPVVVFAGPKAPLAIAGQGAVRGVVVGADLRAIHSEFSRRGISGGHGVDAEKLRFCCVKGFAPRDGWWAVPRRLQDFDSRGARLRALGGGIWLSMSSRSASRKRRSFSTEGKATR